MYHWQIYTAVVKGNSPEKGIRPEGNLENQERRKSNRNSKYLSK
jgi:hypothetical protein